MGDKDTAAANATPDGAAENSVASSGAAKTTEPTTAELSRKLTFSRRLNIILGAAAAFLLVVAIAQPLSQTNPPINPDAISTSAPTTSPAPAESPSAEPTPVDPTEGPERPPLAIQLAKADPNDPMAFGDLAAPVTIIEWTDYRCPFCAKFATDTMPEIIKTYVDAGVVRYEVRDVSFFGEDSTAAAVAARAAGEQGKFAEYFNALYAAAPESGHPDMPVDKLVDFAKQAGVPDIDKFTADLERTDLAHAVAESTTQAQQLGVNAVPFFIVGNTYFSGAQPAQVFHETIAEQLELAQAK